MSEFENMNNEQPTPAPAPVPAPAYVQQASTEDTTPISTWGYVGYLLLFSIPCVGLICMIIFACGGAKNVNLRNFSRGYLILMAIALVLSIILGIVMGGAIASMMNSGYYYY